MYLLILRLDFRPLAGPRLEGRRRPQLLTWAVALGMAGDPGYLCVWAKETRRVYISVSITKCSPYMYVYVYIYIYVYTFLYIMINLPTRLPTYLPIDPSIDRLLELSIYSISRPLQNWSRTYTMSLEWPAPDDPWSAHPSVSLMCSRRVSLECSSSECFWSAQPQCPPLGVPGVPNPSVPGVGMFEVKLYARFVLQCMAPLMVWFVLKAHKLDKPPPDMPSQGRRASWTTQASSASTSPVPACKRS